VLTNRSVIIERIRRHVMRGNDLSPLSELQAAALVPQWKTLDEANNRRRTGLQRLHPLIRDLPGLRILTPPDNPTASGYYKVGFDYDPAAWAGLAREVFCLALRSEGIAFWPGFRGLHRIHASRRFRAPGPLTNADRADERCVLLHHPVLLGDDEDLEQVAVALHKIHAAAGSLASKTFEIPPAPWDRDE
jgi:dTDP-4-amino-4,6-dideoxygalactose transaminase